MVKPALILVHGAWHVPEHYYDFIQSLQNAGYEVFCPRLPTCDQSKRSNTNFLSDTSVVRSQILSLIDDSRDIVMVLHSYGGAVGSEAVQNLSANERATRGLKGGVVRLVYMCGFMLQPEKALELPASLVLSSTFSNSIPRRGQHSLLSLTSCYSMLTSSRSAPKEWICLSVRVV